jgi:hypothetical protein
VRSLCLSKRVTFCSIYYTFTKTFDRFFSKTLSVFVTAYDRFVTFTETLTKTLTENFAKTLGVLVTACQSFFQSLTERSCYRVCFSACGALHSSSSSGGDHAAIALWLGYYVRSCVFKVAVILLIFDLRVSCCNLRYVCYFSCVCIYIHVCIYTYMCVYTYICVYVHTCRNILCNSTCVYV